MSESVQLFVTLLSVGLMLLAVEVFIPGGIVGLIAAIDSYDHDRGRLAPHARMHIRKEMITLIANQRSLLHLPTSVNYHALLLARAETALTAEPGREPTEPEIAQAAGLSLQRLRTVRQALGTFVSLDDTDEDSEDTMSLHESLADEDAVSGDESASAASRARIAPFIPGSCTRNPSATISPIGIRGDSEPNGS